MNGLGLLVVFLAVVALFGLVFVFSALRHDATTRNRRRKADAAREALARAARRGGRESKAEAPERRPNGDGSGAADADDG